MNDQFHAYAASSPGAKLEPFSFNLGELGPEDVEIAVSFCGMCGSDLSELDNDWGQTVYPFIPGHEIVGCVVALGPEAKGLKLGQRVAVGWMCSSCMWCAQCLAGDQHLCPTRQATIVGRHGGFATRIRVQWPWARPLPETLDPATAGPLLCGGVTVFTPLLLHNLPATARVGIIGIGGLGHLALQFANKWGCEVHALTTSDSKEAEARQLGAHFVHNTCRVGYLTGLKASLDLLISTINVPLDLSGLLTTLAPKGRLHLVGQIRQPMPLPAPLLIGDQTSIGGSHTGSPAIIDRMLAFAARHGIAPITETFPMSKVNDAFDQLRSGKVRYRIVLNNDIS